MHYIKSALLVLFILTLGNSCQKENIDPTPAIYKHPFEDDILIEREGTGSGFFGKFQFLNEEVGFLYSTKSILRTIDRGKNWEAIYQLTSNGSRFNSADFESADKGIINYYGAGYKRYMRRTEDGGQTWIDINNNKHLSEPHAGNVHRKLDRLYFATPGVMGISYDQGKNWTVKFNDTSLGRETCTYEFVNYSTGFAYNERSLLKTVDGGHSWKYMGEASDNYYFKFFDALNGIKIAFPEWLYYTIDGGLTWFPTENTDNFTVQDFFIAVSYVNENIVFFIGDHTVYKSEDGGKSYRKVWHIPENKSATYQFGDIHMFDEKNGLINLFLTENREPLSENVTKELLIQTTTGWE